MKDTKIAWTDHTFNPWMGCTKVSEGCRNCYAEKLTKNRMGLSLWGPDSERQRTKSPWQNVRRWNRAAADEGVVAKVFTGSLMDWAEDHPQAKEYRPKMWEVIRECQHLHFQMLTKRTERIAECLPTDWGDGYPNVWIGTTIEDNRVAHRQQYLAETPAVCRFVSYEPAIGPLNEMPLDGVDWLIYGGESGPGHRPEDKQWARDIRDRCFAEGIAFFHKQSSGYRTEMGIELDGELIRQFPIPREFAGVFRNAGTGLVRAKSVRKRASSERLEVNT